MPPGGWVVSPHPHLLPVIPGPPGLSLTLHKEAAAAAALISDRPKSRAETEFRSSSAVHEDHSLSHFHVCDELQLQSSLIFWGDIVDKLTVAKLKFVRCFKTGIYWH